MEINPRVIFERLFGDGSNAAERAQRKTEDRSILVSVTREAGQPQLRFQVSATAPSTPNTWTTSAKSNAASRKPKNR